MKVLHLLVRKYYHARARWYWLQRMLFPSAAELRFIEIMGGRAYTVNAIKHWRTKRPLAIILSLGIILERDYFKREVRVGKYWVDFGNFIRWAIEIDGAAYHRDVVREFERDSYIYQRGWRTMHINAVRLWSDPAKVQADVLRFLNT